MRKREDVLKKRDEQALALMDREIRHRTGFRIDEDTGEANERAQIVLWSAGYTVKEFVECLTRAAGDRVLADDACGDSGAASRVLVSAKAHMGGNVNGRA